jgi:hypothetical protein
VDELQLGGVRAVDLSEESSGAWKSWQLTVTGRERS